MRGPPGRCRRLPGALALGPVDEDAPASVQQAPVLLGPALRVPQHLAQARRSRPRLLRACGENTGSHRASPAQLTALIRYTARPLPPPAPAPRTGRGTVGESPNPPTPHTAGSRTRNTLPAPGVESTHTCPPCV